MYLIYLLLPSCFTPAPTSDQFNRHHTPYLHGHHHLLPSLHLLQILPLVHPREGEEQCTCIYPSARFLLSL